MVVLGFKLTTFSLIDLSFTQLTTELPLLKPGNGIGSNPSALSLELTTDRKWQRAGRIPCGAVGLGSGVSGECFTGTSVLCKHLEHHLHHYPRDLNGVNQGSTETAALRKRPIIKQD